MNLNAFLNTFFHFTYLIKQVGSQVGKKINLVMSNYEPQKL